MSEARFETREIDSLAGPGWVEVDTGRGSRIRTWEIFSKKSKNMVKAPGSPGRGSMSPSNG